LGIVLGENDARDDCFGIGGLLYVDGAIFGEDGVPDTTCLMEGLDFDCGPSERSGGRTAVGALPNGPETPEEGCA